MQEWKQWVCPTLVKHSGRNNFLISVLNTTLNELLKPIIKISSFFLLHSSRVYLSLWFFRVCLHFYFKNTRAKEHWRMQWFSHVSTEFKMIKLVNFKLVWRKCLFTFIIKRIITSEPISNLWHILTVKKSNEFESKYQTVKCRNRKTRLVPWLAPQISERHIPVLCTFVSKTTNKFESTK